MKAVEGEKNKSGERSGEKRGKSGKSGRTDGCVVKADERRKCGEWGRS